VLVATKNAAVLTKLSDLLNGLQDRIGGRLPPALIIDDEADQASLDTKTSQRARNPDLDPGRINAMITDLRARFLVPTYLQVTATPQALFLQDIHHPYRPEFTILIEPHSGQGDHLIRSIPQDDLDKLLTGPGQYVPENVGQIPSSLQAAISIFYVGSTIQYLSQRAAGKVPELAYSFLCHISQRKLDHDKACGAIIAFCSYLRNGLSSSASPAIRSEVEDALLSAYNDLKTTRPGHIRSVSFNDALVELRQYIVGTTVQIINSDKPQDQPQYSRRYNLLVGGTKLSRGVTIKNLLVTYYGREAKRTNMDTMLQHARMYGYRQADLDFIRLFVTPEIRERFRLISESEQGLRDVVEKYPGEEYRGIYIGKNLNPTRHNVLNANNIGAYGGGHSYFPQRPLFLRD
jgi:hypothetical protein